MFGNDMKRARTEILSYRTCSQDEENELKNRAKINKIKLFFFKFKTVLKSSRNILAGKHWHKYFQYQYKALHWADLRENRIYFVGRFKITFRIKHKAFSDIWGSGQLRETFLQATVLCIIQAGLLIEPKIAKLEGVGIFYLCPPISGCYYPTNWSESLFILVDHKEHYDWFLPSPGAETCLPAVALQDTRSLPVVCYAAYTPTLLG